MRWIFPLITTILSLVFSWFVGAQYLERRRAQLLVWTVSLLMFAFATFAEFWSEARGWNIPLYQFYYVASASLVAFMGAGTVYLLYNKKIGHVFLAYTVLVTLIMLVRAFGAEIMTDKFVPGITVAGNAMPRAVRLFSPMLTGPGTLALFGGAIYSWIKAGTGWNLFIALGTAIIAAAGYAARAGMTQNLYPAEMLGQLAIFIGFMWSREVIKARDVRRAA